MAIDDLMPQAPILTSIENQYVLTFLLLLVAIVCIAAIARKLGTQLIEPREHIVGVINENRTLRDAPIPSSVLSLPIEIQHLYDNIVESQEFQANRQRPLEEEVRQRTQDLGESEERWKSALEGENRKYKPHFSKMPKYRLQGFFDQKVIEYGMSAFDGQCLIGVWCSGLHAIRLVAE